MVLAGDQHDYSEDDEHEELAEGFPGAGPVSRRLGDHNDAQRRRHERQPQQGGGGHDRFEERLPRARIVRRPIS
jgi:hypothetical protein